MKKIQIYIETKKKKCDYQNKKLKGQGKLYIRSGE